jgi:prolyl-tRNA synthetase
MRQSQLFTPTLKEIPNEAQIPSHQLMLRAGLIRPLAAGVYSFLPLGLRVKQKVEQIIREEMNAIGGQEFLLPALNPKNIWEETGRVEAMGDVMFHIKNREELVLAPTHEEIITFHARQHIKSYRDLPQIWYQIQTKFRNEPRPKSGVLRGRQFTMKDAYSMDSSTEGLDESYNKHDSAYRKIYTRSGLNFFVVGASSGAMGGSASQEFMTESPYGEDTCAVCDNCEYAANIEVATSGIQPVGKSDANAEIEKFETPGARTIDDLINKFGIAEECCAKSVFYIVDSRPVLILMRGNDELNEEKLTNALKATAIRPAEQSEVSKYSGAEPGSVGPVNLADEHVQVIADNLLRGASGMVSGANHTGFHFKNIDLERDTTVSDFFDLRTVHEGEPCPKCSTPLRVVNAIEVGHIFKLGTKYSKALGATFLNADGEEHPIIMGSYGIGVERIMACFIEQNHDEKGIQWTSALAPFQVHLLGLGLKKSENVRNMCEKLHDEFEALKIEVLYDDRDEMPGMKFNDADLLGFPVQVIVGDKNLSNGNIELKFRKTGDRQIIPVENLVKTVQEFLKSA